MASSRDALRADSDLRAYGIAIGDYTADTQELLPQLWQPDLGTVSDDYGPAAIRRSMDLAAAAGARATRILRAGTAQQALRSFYRSYRSSASALSVTTTGRQRSVEARTSPPPPEPARLA